MAESFTLRELHYLVYSILKAHLEILTVGWKSKTSMKIIAIYLQDECKNASKSQQKMDSDF